MTPSFPCGLSLALEVFYLIDITPLHLLVIEPWTWFSKTYYTVPPLTQHSTNFSHHYASFVGTISLFFVTISIHISINVNQMKVATPITLGGIASSFLNCYPSHQPIIACHPTYRDFFHHYLHHVAHVPMLWHLAWHTYCNTCSRFFHIWKILRTFLLVQRSQLEFREKPPCVETIGIQSMVTLLLERWFPLLLSTVTLIHLFCSIKRFVHIKRW